MGLMMRGVLMGMLMVQVIAAGLQFLSRIILSEGTFIFALMAYRQLVGALFVAPLALFLDRGNLKKLTWSVWFWLFMVALSISSAMGLFYYGLRDTTATFATNFLILIPIITFIFSILLRIEKLGLHKTFGKVKTMGAMLCLIGALIISLYNGKSLYLSHHYHHDRIKYVKIRELNWRRGTLFLIGSNLSYGVWYILQVRLNKIYPYKYTSTMLICIVASMQQVIVGLCIDRSRASWKLGWNLQLITIFYSGALSTAATFCLISWAVAKKGPTYPSMFNPISLILVTIIEALFFGQDVRVGSLLGMCVITAGLYSFLWAKNEEIKTMAQPISTIDVLEQKMTVTVHEMDTINRMSFS